MNDNLKTSPSALAPESRLTRSELSRRYAAVAREYGATYFSELESKAFDRDILGHFALSAQPGFIADLGCGPGHIGHYYHQHGRQSLGMDLVFDMLQAGRKQGTSLPLLQGDLVALPFKDSALAGAVVFYAIIHLSRKHLAIALSEFYRILKPAGLLLLAFHQGVGVVETDNWFDSGFDISANLFENTEISQLAAEAGFEVEVAITRNPYPDEFQNRRTLLWCVKRQNDAAHPEQEMSFRGNAVGGQS